MINLCRTVTHEIMMLKMVLVMVQSYEDDVEKEDNVQSNDNDSGDSFNDKISFFTVGQVWMARHAC